MNRAWAVGLCALAGAALAWAVDRFSPPPTADARLGSAAAFATFGLQEQEFLPPDRAPARWTGARAGFAFRNLPAVPLHLEVRARAHRNPVRVVAGGAEVAQLPPGREEIAVELPAARDGSLDVELVTEPFVAGGGRRLGTLLGGVSLRFAPAWPRRSLLATFAVLALAMATAALLGGLSPAGGAATGVGGALLLAALLWPRGLVHSPYAAELALGLAALAALAALLARLVREERRVTFLAALFALLPAVIALHPLIVGFDAAFHAHKLLEVAGGELFPVSLTQHSPPFRFPYGVSFQALLSPLVWLGASPDRLVETGAVACSVALPALLFLVLRRRGAVLAAGAVLALQLVPWSTEVFSNANYSNAFGQAATLAFFAWWCGGAPGGFLLGATLLATACLGHFSSCVVAVALALALAALRSGELRTDRPRRLALLLGLAVAVLYYGQFLGLMLEQLARLGQGAGGRGTATPTGALLRQLQTLVAGWGLPAMALAVLGRPGPEERDWRAFWLAGAGLALLATFSPLEVRYVYALSPALAAAMAAGFLGLWRRGGAARALGLLLACAQAVLAVRRIAEALLTDWR
jgi:hypothetical protein